MIPGIAMKHFDIEDIQNIASMFTCSIVAANLGFYYLYGQQLHFSILFIIAHFSIDFYFCKPDVKLHHFLMLLSLAFKYNHNISNTDDVILILTCYKTEISTFFYVFKLWMAKFGISNSTLSQINDLCFFMSFFKFRIYDYYVNVIANPWIYTMFEKYTHNDLLENMFLFTSLYGFYFLNIYWFSIMCKILYKQIASNFSKQRLALLTQYITSYIYMYNIPITLYMYSFPLRPAYYFDIIGVVVLSYGCNYYHNNNLDYMSKNSGVIEYTSYEIMKPFFIDKICIHLRSLCLLATGVYGSPIWALFLTVSATCHSVGIITLLNYLYNLKSKGEVVQYAVSENKKEDNLKYLKAEQFLSITNYMVSIPVIIDICIVGIHSESMMHHINLIVTTAWIANILYIQPFYELNHVLLHFSLIVQNIFLCLCNQK